MLWDRDGFEDPTFSTGNLKITDRKVMDSSDIFDTASQEGEEEYEEELSAAEVVLGSFRTWMNPLANGSGLD